MYLRSFYKVLLLLPVFSFGGCGTVVPQIQENPFASESDKSDLIQAIVRNVKCEIQDSVVRLYSEQAKTDPLNRNLYWFDNWAAQVSLSLTIDEKGALSPSANLLPPSPITSIFNIGLGATASSEAQRVDKIGSFFTVQDLKKLGACDPAVRGRGPFILQSDLKLYEWLAATMVAIDNNDTPVVGGSNGPFKSNVLSHQVKFEIVTSGTVTPGWKLTNATVNQSGNLFSASRDRTQDLTITFGPADPQFLKPVIDPLTNKPKIDPITKKQIFRPTELASTAKNIAFSNEISVAITNGIRGAIRP